VTRKEKVTITVMKSTFYYQGLFYGKGQRVLHTPAFGDLVVWVDDIKQVEGRA
jgi:hypothetical protein